MNARPGTIDLIVIGSGINGLVAATMAAKKGRNVVVIERRQELGGLASGEDFHPGFRTAGVLHDTTALRPWVVEALELTKHGLKFKKDETPVYTANSKTGGRSLLLWRDPAKAQEELAPHSTKDAQAYKAYRAFLGRIQPFMASVFDQFPPDLSTMSFPGLWDLFKKATTLRLLGRADMMEVLRIGPMCVADWLSEWFESDLVRAASAAPTVYHSFTGPWSPGTNANLLLGEAFAKNPVDGGPEALVAALLAAAKVHGVVFKTGVGVAQVNIVGQKATGVTLSTGEVIDAPMVAAACDPKTLFLDLLEPRLLPLQFATNIQNIRSRGTTAKIDLALSAYPELAGRPNLKAEIVRTGDHVDQIERAFDAVKYRQMSVKPVIDAWIPTVGGAGLAPSGQHVLQMLVHFAPEALDGGWTEAAKEQLFNAAITSLEIAMPTVRQHIVGRRVVTPADMKTVYGLAGGQMLHGEHAADQLLVRPTPECSRYATPFAGLFLCGSGSHPGGGLTGAPGGLAVRAMFG